MSTFAEDEASVEDSEPREGIEINTGIARYRIALGTRSVVIDGFTYNPEPAARGEVGVSASGDSRELIISLPMSHAVCRRYMAGGVPPRQILVNVWRKQLRSGEVEQVWSGYVTSMAPSGHVGNFRVPSRSADTFERRLPTITAGKSCPHILFDANCRVVRADFTVTTTAATVAGRVVTVAGMGGHPDAWAEFGELIHTASGERMTVQSQDGNVVTMQLPIYELQAGDEVQVAAGCDHTIGTGCRDKFDNVANFGGQPDPPTTNPHVPNGFGVFQSE